MAKKPNEHPIYDKLDNKHERKLNSIHVNKPKSKLKQNTMEIEIKFSLKIIIKRLVFKINKSTKKYLFFWKKNSLNLLIIEEFDLGILLKFV